MSILKFGQKKYFQLLGKNQTSHGEKAVLNITTVELIKTVHTLSAG